ncbi:hypothetical protein MKUB_30120 [Mycobacterium kubicae]|nr:hypothetical protein [Mycobacterium kubicae]ORV98920.1 hypothetical protein AWC13_12000 [Mycobacterium kubicae]GFG65522.1 hypothetical protein MKUB_30120 [Mycobacterium kubicae]
MANLIIEAGQMPDAAIRFAQGIGQVWTPEHLVPLRTRVRQQHAGQLRSVFRALDQRFGEPNGQWMGVFRAAAEMAVMVEVVGDVLPAGDRQLLRNLWATLLRAT